MTLYVSEKKKEVTVRREEPVFSQKTGERIGVRRRVFAEFRQGGVPEWALPLCESRFTLGGKPSDIPTARWLCAYDSNLDQQDRGWTKEEHALIEETLARKHGIVVIEPRKVEAPWPAYDKLVVHGQRKIEHVVAKIVETVREDGYDPATVAAYERQELKRPEVLAALDELSGNPGEDEAEPLIAA